MKVPISRVSPIQCIHFTQVLKKEEIGFYQAEMGKWCARQREQLEAQTGKTDSDMCEYTSVAESEKRWVIRLEKYVGALWEEPGKL